MMRHNPIENRKYWAKKHQLLAQLISMKIALKSPTEVSEHELSL